MCSEGTEVKMIGISSTMLVSFTSPKSEASIPREAHRER